MSRVGEQYYLNHSVLYNEDDCRATKLIKEWVAGDLPPNHVPVSMLVLSAPWHQRAGVA